MATPLLFLKVHSKGVQEYDQEDRTLHSKNRVLEIIKHNTLFSPITYRDDNIQYQQEVTQPGSGDIGEGGGRVEAGAPSELAH